ncbi:hypothetical protein KJ870_04480 [bacterium]|nr:hypothetical protein [bacterium]MBU1434176.1 hypothetical protein [bacterium]MBU1504271.1 hypothetical protein [bacterium]
MRITTKLFHGPNIYANVPIVLITIKVLSAQPEVLIETCKEIEKFLPNYVDENISKILTPYTHFGMLMSNFAFNLINKNKGLLTSYGAKESSDAILSWVEFDTPEVTLKAIELFFNIFLPLLQKKQLSSAAIDQAIVNYAEFAKKYSNYDYELLSGSKSLDIPSFKFMTNSLYRQYGWGKNSRVFRGSSPMEDSYHGVFVSMDKVASKELLKSIGMPVVKDVVIQSREQLQKAAETIGYPCVVKPIRGAQAIGISVNILSFDELQNAFDHAKQSSFGNNPIMIEENINGYAHRIHVVRGKFFVSIKKMPPILIGNGISTIQSLIEEINIQRMDVRKNPDSLKQIQINDELIVYLKKFHLTLQSILSDNQEFQLSTTFTYGVHGASIENTTNITHPDIIHMAEAIAKVTHIDMLAIDYITSDISKSFHEIKSAICEYNHTPGLGSLKVLGASLYTPLEVARTFIGDEVGRIPIFLVLVENSHLGKIDTWFINNIKESSVGYMCGDKVAVGRFVLNTYESQGWDSAKMLLRQKTTDKVFLICDKEEVLEKGLPVDSFDTIFYDQITDDWLVVLDNATARLQKYSQLDVLFELLEKELSN